MSSITQRRLDALRSEHCKLRADYKAVCQQRDELLANCKRLLKGAHWTLQVMPDIPSSSTFRAYTAEAEAVIAKIKGSK